MPTYWKVLTKKFLFNIFFFTLFFLSLTMVFKFSRLSKYLVSGIDLQEILLCLGVLLYKIFPFAISLVCLISAFIGVRALKQNNELEAFASLGLKPQKLFSPLIILSIMFALFNVAATFIISPQINIALDTLLQKKKENIQLLDTFSRRFNRDGFFISLDSDPRSKKASNLLMINPQDHLSFAIAENISESDKGLTFYSSSAFEILPEKDNFNTITYSYSKESFFPKDAIFSIFPKSTLRIAPLKFSKEESTIHLIYAMYPIIFTLFGIIIALNIFCALSFSSLLYTLIVFAISTITIKPITIYLTLSSFALAISIYTLALKSYRRRQG